MVNRLSAVDCIAPAFEQTKHQLFAPFRLQRWLRLALVCLLTGEFTGGGGVPQGNFHFPVSRPRGGRGLASLPNFDWGKILPWLPWIVAAVVLLFALILLWIYVGSVFRFVLLDSVLYDRCQLKGGWTRWEAYGRSYFLWSLTLLVVSAIGSILLIGAPALVAWRAGLFHHAREHLAALILGGATLLLILFAFFVAIAIVGLFAKDFCIPIMAMENLRMLAAWRRLFPLMSADKMAFAAYVGMKIVLAIACAVAVGLAGLLIFVVVLIPLAIAALIIFLVGKALGLTLSAAVIILLALTAIVLVGGLIYLGALLNTPPMVFFQSYTLHFLGSRYPALGAVMFPPAPGTSNLPAPGLPPLIEPSMG